MLLTRNTASPTATILLAAFLVPGCNEHAGLPPLPDTNVDCSQSFADADKLTPMTRQQLGLTMQTAGAVNDLLSSEGRREFWATHEAEGAEAALRKVRENAAMYAITCGPADAAYRSGVCLNFQLMCETHGGGGCGLCARKWAAEQCRELLGKVADVPLEIAKDAVGYDEEWKSLMSTADDLSDAGLSAHLDNAHKRLLDDPIEANCYELF